ncbi:MAG: hypothetical protein JO323_14625 [Acidobacteriia bacterium]|nr:hypothetical protein [Terriglobia bacterium]
MNTYEVTAWCVFPHYATFEVQARSLKAALAKAKKQVQEETPEPCNGGPHNWDEMEVRAEDGRSLQYLSPQLATEIAAPELLDLLRSRLHAARTMTEAWERGIWRRACEIYRCGWWTQPPPSPKLREARHD